MNVDFNIINQKGSPAIFSDTYANRPAASYPGRLFISTDTKEIYRDTGSAWEEIAGSGSGNIQGSGTANYVPKFTDTETIGNSQIRDDGTGVGIGVAPSAVYKLDISGSQRNTLTAAGGLSIVQSGVLEASYGVYNSSSGAAFLFEKKDDATATFTDSGIYANGGFYTKVFDGTTNFYNSFFSNGNVAFNSVTDSGYKFDCNGTGSFSGALTGTSATFSGNGAFSGVLQVAPTTGTGIIGVGDNFGGGMNVGIYRGGAGVTTTGNYLNIGGYDGVIITTGAAALGSQTTRLTIASTGTATFSSSVEIGNTVAVSVATPSTHKVTMVIGGNTYYLLASNV